MTHGKMDQLANDALQESGLSYKLFAIDHVQSKAHVWALSFSDPKNKFFEVQIDLYEQNTDDAIKGEIRRQLEGMRED